MICLHTQHTDKLVKLKYHKTTFYMYETALQCSCLICKHSTADTGAAL